MNIQTQTVLGEIKFEFRDDGGGLAHVVRTDKTFVRDLDTGDLLMAPRLAAVAITQEQLEEIVAENFAEVAAQVVALQAEVAAKAAEIATLTEAKTKAEQDKAAAEGRADAVEAAKDEADDAHASQLAALNATHAAQIEQLQAQIAELQGIQPDPANLTVTNSQARDALLDAGLLGEVLAYMTSLPPTDRVWIYWEYSPTFSRSHPLIAQMAQRLALEDDMVDALFAAAALK